MLTTFTFCGGKTGTRDHCPSRVLLDEPYPENLPVVPACRQCNGRFSDDEEYLACLLSCVVVGSTDPAAMPRKKTRRILMQKPALRARLEQARTTTNERTVFQPEIGRVVTVVTKLAQGHALYELGEPSHGAPDGIAIRPLPSLSEAESKWFEFPSVAPIWPEVGSRAMQRLALGGSDSGWLRVQAGRYRFHATVGNGVEIRIVIDEYLAGYCRWQI